MASFMKARLRVKLKCVITDHGRIDNGVSALDSRDISVLESTR